MVQALPAALCHVRDNLLDLDYLRFHHTQVRLNCPSLFLHACCALVGRLPGGIACARGESTNSVPQLQHRVRQCATETAPRTAVCHGNRTS